jgi:hypothetical protein
MHLYSNTQEIGSGVTMGLGLRVKWCLSPLVNPLDLVYIPSLLCSFKHTANVNKIDYIKKKLRV